MHLAPSPEAVSELMSCDLKANKADKLDKADKAASSRWPWLIYVAILAGFLGTIIFNLETPMYRPVVSVLETHRWAKAVFYPSLLWGVMGMLLVGFRTILWLRYRSLPQATFEEAPRLSVIIPAYNEGPMVRKSIESAVRALYPRDRLEILVIDDGSKDDTWQHIQACASEFPGLVRPFRLPRNRGKREALALGFEQASGQVFVTIDSDSVIDRNALLALVGPLRDPRVGAVAGRVGVYNRHAGLIPRMLHVRFILSFDMLRAAESGYRTVYCCPGALTAYRADVVRSVMPEWRRQKFLGAHCTFGEDRAMTNWILKRGYDTVYQSSALVNTMVPQNYSKLCRMFLRWDRSYVREELRFMRIVWKRPFGPRVIALVERAITNLRYPVNYASMAMFALFVASRPEVLPRFVLSIGMLSLFYTMYFLRSERSLHFLYGVVYAFFSTFTLFWIFPYAVFTARARSWLTR
jgi:hyaluronan synthase